MKKILFIYHQPLDGSFGGSQGTLKALEGLKSNFELIKYNCKKKPNRFLLMIRNLLGYSADLSFFDCHKVLNILSRNDLNGVFFDFSLHGRLVKKIKQKFPRLKVVVNYHNCEQNYYRDLVKTSGLLYLPLYLSALLNEKLSLRYADYHVLISEQDKKSLGIKENYCIIPVTLADKFSSKEEVNECNIKYPYILFVGFSAFSNVEAVQFIIEKISPYVSQRFVIVGKGMKSSFPNEYKNVEIFDFVPSLSTLYKNSVAVISPLFHGSGAKVKVAEALMYGKKIIGTESSFYGYDMKSAAYDICNTQNEFINAIKELNLNKTFYSENRDLFLKFYSSGENKKYYGQLDRIFNK